MCEGIRHTPKPPSLPPGAGNGSAGRRPSLPRGLAEAALLLAVAALAVLPVAAPGQEAVPLSKTDLVRMLVGATYSQEEIASIVRRSCLSFRPTERDLENFRELEADPEVIDAVRSCLAGEASGAAPPGLVLSLPGQAAAVVGETLQVRGRVERGGEGRPGVAMTLVGLERPGGRPVEAVSGPGGEIVFRVPAGYEAGSYQLRPRAAGGTLAQAPTLRLQVRPKGPARAEVQPTVLSLVEGRTLAVDLRVEVRDLYGNAVPGQEVVARPGGDPDGGALATGVTGPDGAVRLTLDALPLQDGQRVAVWAGGTRVATVPVRVRGSDQAGPRSPSSGPGRTATDHGPRPPREQGAAPARHPPTRAPVVDHGRDG